MAGLRVAGRLPRVGSKTGWLRPRRLVAILWLVTLLAIGGGTAAAYITIKSHVDQLQANLAATFQAGQHELEAGKDSLKEANTKHDPKLINQAVDHFVAAKVQFLAANHLADNSRLLKYSESVPAVGEFAYSRHMAVVGIAQMGAALSDAGQEISAINAQFLGSTAKRDAGRSLLSLVDDARPRLPQVRADLVRAQKSASQVDAGVLPSSQQGSFVKATETIASGLAGLDEFERLIPVLTEVLGGNGTRTYLVEQVNPAELRAGGGFIGTYSLLRADHGSLQLIRSGDSYWDLVGVRPPPGQPGFIPQPTPYREVIPDISWSLMDSNIYPDFPSNAQIARSFVEPRIGKIDGVISMDYYTVAKILGVTGPLAVPGFPTLDTNNFIPLVMKPDVAQAAGHKEIFSAVAGTLMSRVTTFPADQWPRLLEALNDLASKRHLQAYFNNKEVENEMNRVGWSGVVNPTSSREFMMEVEDNYYGDKANYFLDRQFTVELTRRGALLHHKITVNLTNSEPLGLEDRSTYKVSLRFFVSDQVVSLSSNLRPVRFKNPAAPSGLRLIDGWLPDIPCCGARGQAIFEFDSQWPNRDGGIVSIYWQKQPGTVSDRVDVSWNDGSGHSFTTKGDLSQDRIVYLSPSGISLLAAKPALATLPSLGLG